MPAATTPPDEKTDGLARPGRRYKRYPRAFPIRLFRWVIRLWWILPVAYLGIVAFDAILIWPRQGFSSLRNPPTIVSLIGRDDAVAIALTHAGLALAILLALVLSARLHRWATLDLRTERRVLALRAENASPTFRLLTDQSYHEPYEGGPDPFDAGPTIVLRDTGPTSRRRWRKRTRLPFPKPSDPLGYERFVETISRLIVASADSTPLAISIEGEWGMGKTSAMQMLLDRLDGRRFSTGLADNDRFRFEDWRCITIWFNVWKYRGTDVQRAFLNEVYEEIPHKWLLGPMMWFHMLGLAVDTASSVLPFGGVMARATKDLDERAKWRVKAEGDFKTILRRLRGWDGRHPLVVIFIDDLDRCAPTEVARVLEMMKLFFDTRGCVFVLGFDLKLVADSVRRDYQGVIGDGLDYLKKIVQVNYALPVPSESGFAALVEVSVHMAGLAATLEALDSHIIEHEAHQMAQEGEQHERLPKYVRLIACGTGGNPRELKRFLNTFVVNVQLIDGENYYPSLCVLLLLQVHWVRCYFEIVRTVKQGKYQYQTFAERVERYLGIYGSDSDRHGPNGASSRSETTSSIDATSAEAWSNGDAASIDLGTTSIADSAGIYKAEPPYTWLADEDLQVFLTRYRLSDYSDDFAYLVGRVGLPTAPPPSPSSPPEAQGQPPAQSVMEQAAEVAHEVAVAAAQQRVEEIVARLPKLPSESDIAGPPLDIGLLPEPEHFVGREDDLAWIEARLRAGGLSAMSGLFGLAGIGKTALAAVAARRLYAEGRFPDGVAVISCLERDDAPGVLRDVLLRFIPQDVPPNATPAALATLAVARLRGRDALVVLDNVEPELALAEVLQPLRDAGLTVLITARQTLPLPPAARRALDLLPDAAALDLFAEWYGRSTAAALSPAEAAAAQRIITALGNHTLAVKLAGAQAADLTLPLEQFAAQVAAHPLDLEGQGADATLALKETLLRSVSALPASGDLGDVRRLFAALAAVATPEFGRRAATALGAALALPDPGRALDLLLRRALLDADHAATLPDDEEEEGADADRERLRLHPLLRELAAERLDEPTRATAALALARFYADYSNETSDPARALDAANIAGAIEWAHEQAADDEAAAQALVRMCLGMRNFWRDRSRTRDSLRYLPWGLAAAERLATPGARDDQLTIARLQLSYATALITAGRLPEAEEYLNRSLAIRRAVGETRGEGVALSKLGDILVQRGDLAGAQANYERVLAIMRDVGDTREEGVALGNLGDLLVRRGDLAGAQANYERYLAIMRAVGDTRGEGVALSKLGDILVQRGDLAGAQANYERYLAIMRAVGDTRGEGVALDKLGDILVQRSGGGAGELRAGAGDHARGG
jgi:tetratricopeptide (TPR) repeat protein